MSDRRRWKAGKWKKGIESHIFSHECNLESIEERGRVRGRREGGEVRGKGGGGREGGGELT